MNPTHFPLLGLVLEDLHQRPDLVTLDGTGYLEARSSRTMPQKVKLPALLSDEEREAVAVRVLAHLQAAEDELVALSRPG